MFLTSLPPTNQVNVLVRSTRNTASLPMHASQGKIRVQISADSEVFEQAATHTASKLADMWYNFAKQIPVNANDHVCNDTDFSTGKSANAFAALKSWQPQQQLEEMKKAGFHSSLLLSPFLDDHDTDHPHALLSTDPVYFNPYSEECYKTLVNALDLDSPKYSNITENVMSNFKNLLRRCPEAFHIPGSALGIIKGFYHNIDTGESPPVYKLPYRTSPAESLAIKAELERIFALNFIRPSRSAWGGGGGGGSLHLSVETTGKGFTPAPTSSVLS